MPASVYIVILNWNGWRDTIECLESVFRMTTDFRFRVIVCDNNSTDDSVSMILDWARGMVPVDAKHPDLKRLSCPPVAKPLAYAHLQLVSGGLCFVADTPDASLVIIETGANLGFAGGCNIGIRYALGDPACKYIWLLNNDTVVEATALAELVGEAKDHPEIGLTGSTLHSYYQPDMVQAYGGTTYNHWMARTPAQKKTGVPQGKDLDCILGCSMLVSRSFLDQVGLMREDYFLYFEELDWAKRGRPQFELGIAPTSHVYHKEGASIGSSTSREKRSSLSERYLSRNRILFTRRYYPKSLPSVFFWVYAAAFLRLLKGDPQRASLLVKASGEGMRAPLD